MKYFSRPIIVLALIVLALVATEMPHVAYAQSAKPIDFSNLARASGARSKSFPIKGLGTEANSMLIDFMEADGMERSEISARRQALSESAPASPSAQTSSPASASSDTYLCYYQCTNANLLGSDKTRLSVTIRASSKDAAIDEVIKHGKATCYQQTQRIYDTGSQSCKKQ
jgi:hypothetical protein